jgi:2-amino-4-hydroxy-6-hydroxymethyldihydropteridine diphosphokinase
VSDTVHIGLGSNLGARERNLARAVDALRSIDAVEVTASSSLYDTAPMGPEQPRYLNAVVRLQCSLQPTQLLTILKQIETDLGRTASSAKWAPRPIDLDILLWDGRLVAEGNLQVPHLELHRRRFVLEPLCEVDPKAWHPMLGETVESILRRLAPQDVVRLEGVRWT